MLLIVQSCFLHSSPLDVVSGTKPSPYDTAELLDPVEDHVAPLPSLPDFVTVPSEAINMSSEI